jgi:hypothetical protein
MICLGRLRSASLRYVNSSEGLRSLDGPSWRPCGGRWRRPGSSSSTVRAADPACGCGRTPNDLLLSVVRIALQAENVRRQRATFLSPSLPQCLLDRGEALGAEGGRSGSSVARQSRMGRRDNQTKPRADCQHTVSSISSRLSLLQEAPVKPGLAATAFGGFGLDRHFLKQGMFYHEMYG